MLSVNVNEFAWKSLQRRTLQEIPFDERPVQVEFMVVSVEAEKKSNCIHLFGTTRQGDSVCCSVTGFRHFFWAKKPVHVSSSQLDILREGWNESIIAARRYAGNGDDEPIAALSLHEKYPLYYHTDSPGEYLKVELSTPNDLYGARDFLSSVTTVYEEREVSYELRFMTEMGLTGFGWCSMSQYRITTKSSCTWSITGDVRNFDVGSQYNDITPTRYMDFDIECCATKGFPQPQRDPVIQIAVQVHEVGSGVNRCLLDALLYTKPTATFNDETVMAEYTSEEELLRGFQRLVMAVDYDVSRNYNGRNFDWSYLMRRAEALRVQDFAMLGRLRGVPATLQSSQFESKARGKRAFDDVHVPGRTDFDILHVVRCEEKLRSYKLNDVAAELLGDAKDDVHHTQIPILYNGTPEDRAKLGKYCRKDALLCRLIDEKKMYSLRYIEQGRVCRVTLEKLITQGQQIKILAQMLRLAREFNFVCATKRYESTPMVAGEQYEGALVLEPMKGFHTEPIVCMDFSSLYPSLAIAYNLCYTTLVRPADVHKYDPDDLRKTPAGYYFVKKHVREGLFCILLKRLLVARKVAKADAKTAANEATRFGGEGDTIQSQAKREEAATQTARQLAIKLAANSGYGFTGTALTSGGKVPCREVAESITAYGREALVRVQRYITETYPGSKIAYGDTDSVMVKPNKCNGVTNVPEAMAWMNRVAEEINDTMWKDLWPMKLAPEKVMYPTLLQQKKKYCCGYYESNPETPDMVYYKGIEVARRDSCLFAIQCFIECCEKIFLERNVDEAVRAAKNAIERLYLGNVDMDMLILTSSLSQAPEEYKTPQAHTVLAQRMAKRDPASAPVVGDRMGYVMVGGGKSIRDMAEDPEYARKHDLQPNVDYYLDNQLRKPLERLFKPIIGVTKTAELFRGEHTRRRVTRMPVGDAPAGSLLSFVQLTRTCQQCNETYNPKKHRHQSLCRQCSAKDESEHQ